MKGSVYILKNVALGTNVCKIGMTLREPSARAREFYFGASGVPQPFELVCSVLVGNCKEAERRIHRQLASYRINARREFFLLPSKAAAIMVFNVCCEINSELGMPPPAYPHCLKGAAKDSDGSRLPSTVESSCDGGVDECVEMPLRQRHESPVGRSILTSEQRTRAEVLDAVLPPSFFGESTCDSLSRDVNPERELRIMEHIAKAFLSMDHVSVGSEKMQREVLSLLLERSCKSSREVLSSFRGKHLTKAMAKRLVDSYELKPYPLVVQRME